jgi:prophage regulatory protein
MTYISDKQIAERWGVHRVTPWKLAKSLPEFPKPVKLSPGVTRWKLSDIELWEAAKTAAT